MDKETCQDIMKATAEEKYIYICKYIFLLKDELSDIDNMIKEAKKSSTIEDARKILKKCEDKITYMERYRKMINYQVIELVSQILSNGL